MRRHVYIWSVILLLALAAGFLAGCSGSAGDGGGETGAAWDPGTAADAESGSSADGGESKEEYLPEPGDFVIGTMTSGNRCHKGLLGRYAAETGVKIEVREFVSDRDMIEAARQGEIDLAVGNDLINLILASEGCLQDLEPVLGKHLGTGGYYDTVLESGRVNGKLLIAVPHFQLSHIVMTPRKTLDSFGGIPSDMEKLNAYYDSLDSGLRSGGAYPEEFELMIDAGLDIPKAHVDLEDSVREWRSFLRKRIKDASPEAVGKYGVSLFEWSGTGGEPFFDLGSLENRYAEAGAAADGADAEAVLIPFPLRKDTGFVINTVSGAVPEKAAHAEAAKAYVSWLFSEVGQNEILNHRGEDEYPVALPVLKDAAHQWIDRQSAYGENAEGAEKERMQRENHENADRYIEKADRILANSWGFAKSVERVIFLRTAGEKDRRQEMTFIDEKTEGVLFRYAEAMTGKDATPRFHEDDTYDDWPAFIEGFIADYLADLGYEVTKAG